MRIERAYSIELGKDITAEEADKLFAEKIVASKHLFKCPEKNCLAQVTCANLDRPKRLRKRDPYFKFVSEHSPGCQLEAETDEDLRRVKSVREDPEALPFIRDDIVEIDLSPLNMRFIRDIPSSGDEEDITKRQRKIAGEEQEDNNQRRHSRKRLSGLVNSFIAKENFFLNTAEGKLHLRDFFISINDRKDLSTYIDEPRIYYGKAWINRKDDYYLVRFDNEMKAGMIKYKPTFFIPSRLVDSSEYRRTSREKLDELAMATPPRPLYLFISSELPPVKSNVGDYINFKLDDLTYLYYLPWGKKK